MLQPLQERTEKYFKSNTRIKSLVEVYFEPMIALIINFIMIPFLIDIACFVEDYRRKSTRSNNLMRRIFFFMFLNTLILPILKTSVHVFFQMIAEKEFGEIA